MKVSAHDCTDGVDVGPIDSDQSDEIASAKIAAIENGDLPPGMLRQGDSGRRGRFLRDVRSAERKRIARELHDTLLQGLQGILLEIELFSQSSALTDEQRKRAIKIERQLRSIVVDGRDAICELRSTIDARDWVALILEMGNRLALNSRIEFSLHIKGVPWNMQPKVRSEVLAIVREGLRNAFEHSHARAIGVIICYTKRRVRISIEDDGIGISEQQLQRQQKVGHWGIVGMRERAEKLGGKLTIASWLSSGTTIHVFVPRRFSSVVHRLLIAPRMYFAATEGRPQRRPLIDPDVPGPF